MANARPRTRPGKLSELARHVVLPSGIVSTGWPPVRDLLGEWGIEFDEWQDGAGRAILARRADGLYAATVGGVVLSIPRQVAKTFLVSRLVVALCVLFPRMRVLWTAHRTRTATNTFRSLQGFCQSKRVAPYVASIRSTNGEQEIAFVNGSVILFGAREQGFGRGFDEIDVEVFDEAQILTEKALEDMVAATNQARNPHGALLLFMGTPPRPVDPGEAFTYKRERALSGKADDTVYIEFSADPDGDPDDREQIMRANPSVPHRTPWESMARLRENLPSDDAWWREALGRWDAVASSGVMPMDLWAEREDTTSVGVDVLTLGVEVGPDAKSAAVGLAARRADGDVHMELEQHRAGADWLIGYVRDLVEANPSITAVVADVGGPIKAFVEQRAGRYFLHGTRVEITPMRVSEVGAACMHYLDGIRTGWLRHIGQLQLTHAAATAGKRTMGETGLWTWTRKNEATDPTPVQATSWAVWGVLNNKQTTKPRRRNGRAGEGSGRRAVIL